MSHEPPSTAATGEARARTLALALGALGVVYGDIGTSPLYALKECFHGLHAIEVSRANVLGVLSLVFWSLIVVVSFKYLAFITRADNRGEGGMFALLALLPPVDPQKSGRARGAVVMAGLFGASLLYGDGVITPSISVLSAVEGLAIATPGLKVAVVPLTLLVLVGLFAVQAKGTGGIGRVFGPVMLLWFLSLAALGISGIAKNPAVLAALNPWWAYHFFEHNQLHGMVVLGSVVLAITGAEALYADLGHFGRRPIQLSWFAIVFPCLILNYLGQGALVLGSPAAASNPFYGLVPRPLLYPMVALSTAATVIASQALISGAFSLTRQAVQLGYLPRVHIVHTSGREEGQIYIPEVNWALMVTCLGLVVAFGESSRLAAAYGIAVTTDMVITSVVFFYVTQVTWRWPLWRSIALVSVFLVFDLAYFGANLFKFFDGGWFPVALAIGILIVMRTWKDGRAELGRRIAASSLPLDLFLDDLAHRTVHRVGGTAVFMSTNVQATPPVLLHHFKHNQVLHEKVVLLSVGGADVPYVTEGEQLVLDDLGQGFYRLTASYGFMQTPNVPDIMRRAYRLGLSTDPQTTSYFLGRETLLTGGAGGMMRWRKALFAFVSKNSRTATAYFGLPPGRVVELGMQIDL